jgi:hypothetical protein
MLGQKDLPGVDLGSFEGGLRFPTQEQLKLWEANQESYKEWYLTPGELKLFQLFMNHRHEEPSIRRQLAGRVIRFLQRWL